jgi:hypothetical protein
VRISHLNKEQLDEENWKLLNEVSRLTRINGRLWEVIDNHELTEEALRYVNKNENIDLERKTRES